MSVIYGQPITLGGKKAEGEIPITANGIYDVAEYATANVNVQSAPVLLWTNASPTSAFAAQTVSLPTGYSGYIVEVLSYYNRPEKSYGFFNVGSGYSAVLAYTGSQIFGRLINSAAANGIQFGGPVMNSYGNNEGIPQRIWGVKFTVG